MYFKIFLIAVLAICSHSGLANGQTQFITQIRDNLLQRANFLINLVSGEAKLLEFEGHNLARDGLEIELRALLGVQLELRATSATNATEAEIIQLENVLNTIETRIGQLLTQVGLQYISLQEINMLVRRTQEFLGLVSDTVHRLKTANRSIEARGLESMQLEILQLEISIRSTQNPIELRQLEEILIQAEYQIVEIILGLEKGGVRRKRDLRSDLIARANELIALANAAIRQLRARNQNTVAEVIVQTQSSLQLVVTDLNATTNATVIARLENELIQLEYQLTDELRTVGQPIDVQEYRRLLLTSAQALQQFADSEIASLTAANQTNQTTVIRNEANTVARIARDLQNATIRAQLQELETQLSTAEYRLYEQLLQLQRPEAYRQSLIRNAEQIAVSVAIEIRALLRANRSLEAEGLLAEQQQLILLDVQLRDASTVADIRTLEQRLQGVEERVTQQLQRLGVRVTARRRRDLRADVLARANELISLADTAVRQLRARNRNASAEAILITERQLQSLVADLNATTNATVVSRLENELIQLEYRLTEELRTVGQPIDVQEYRRLLLTSAQALQQFADSEIAALTAANQTNQTTVIRNEANTVAQIARELQNATTRAQLQDIETRLGLAEYRLYEELLRLQRPEAYRRNLIRDAEDLAVSLVIEIRALVNANRSIEAEGLRAEEQQLVLLDVQLRDATTIADIRTLEQRLQGITERVYTQLSRLGVRVTAF